MILGRDVPVLLELIPVHRRASEKSVSSFFDRYVLQALDRLEINGFNIPEIVDENFRGEPFYRYMDPRDFARVVRENGGAQECVVSKVVVHCRGGRPELEEWAEATLRDYGIRNVVAVGAYLPDFDYPGPSVLEANEVLKSVGLTCGNVMIPEREGESQRMLAKTEAGTDFFTTQAIFSVDRFIQVLEKYYALCDERSLPCAAVLASFTPVSEEYDIEYIRWLGANIEPATERGLMVNGEEGLAAASIELAVKNWRRIRSALEKHEGASVGLNIEYIHRHNFEATMEMGSRLAEESSGQ